MFGDETVLAVVGYLQSRVTDINAVLGVYNLNLRGTDILDYESQVMSIDRIPCMMLGEELTVKKSWNEAHYGIVEQYSFDINGYLSYSDVDHNARAIRRFAQVVSQVLEDKRCEELPLPYYEWKLTWPADQPPASQIEVGYAFIGDAFCRSFHIQTTFVLERNALIHGVEGPQ